MDRDTSLAFIAKFAAVVLAAPVLVVIFFFPQVFESLPNYGRLLLMLPAVIGATLWSLASPGSYYKWQAIGGIVVTVLLVVGVALWYFISPDARA